MKRILTGVILISLSAFSCKKGVIVEPELSYTLVYLNKSSGVLVIDAISKSSDGSTKVEEVVIPMNGSYEEHGSNFESTGLIETADRLIIKYDSKEIECSDNKSVGSFRYCLFNLGVFSSQEKPSYTQQLTFTDESLGL